MKPGGGRRSVILPAAGLPVHMVIWGPDDSDRPVLLIHGLGSNALIWDLTARHLARAGLKVFAPDLRGHGQTAKAATGYSFQVMAEDIARILSRLGVQRPVVVGHSWGAYLALEFACRHRRGCLAPSGLVLVDGGIVQLNDVPGASWKAMREALAPPPWKGVRQEALMARLTDPNRPFRFRGRALDGVLANFQFRGDGTVAPRMSYRRHLQLLRALWAFQTYRAFEQVSCPVLMVPARPPAPLSPMDGLHLERKHLGLARARLAIDRLEVTWMEDSQHDLPLQRPRALANRIAAFVKAVQ
jgi:pimeloyl-ACP methyl ester carboxylesterase